MHNIQLCKIKSKESAIFRTDCKTKLLPIDLGFVVPLPRIQKNWKKEWKKNVTKTRNTSRTAIRTLRTYVAWLCAKGKRRADVLTLWRRRQHPRLVSPQLGLPHETADVVELERNHNGVGGGGAFMTHVTDSRDSTEKSERL